MNKGKMARDKGQRGEREVAKILTKLMGLEHVRSGAQSRVGDWMPDVVTEDPQDDYLIHWEAKRVEKLNIWQAMEQAIADCKEPRVPVVAHRKNGQPWLVTFKLHDLVEFATNIYLGRLNQ